MSQLTFEGIVPSSAGWYKGRTLSHSSISLYRTCPQRWKFRYVDKVPEKPKSFFSFGKSVHNGLEFLFEKIGEELPTLEALLENYKTNWISEGYETAPQEKWFYQEGERILRGFYAKHQGDRTKIFKVEYKFQTLIEGVPVMGYIDRIDSTPNGGLALLDYKTGKAFDKSRVRTDSQITLYQIACQDIFQKPVESVTLYHLNSLTPLTVPAHSKKLEDDLKAAVVTAAQGISAEKFDPKPDDRGHCQWCDYMQICPAFAGKKITSLTPSASEVSEKADRLGKLDSRLSELKMERAALAEDVAATLKVTGQEFVQGKHFVLKREKSAEGAPDQILTEPIDPAGAV